jgi:hypothetical protein
MFARRSRWELALVTALAGLVATACGSGTSEPKGNAAASHIQIVSGNGQVGLVGQALSTPLTVKVTSTTGAPLAGVTVTFAVTSGTATVSPGTTTTDANGQAKTNVTLGSSPGNVQISATVNGTTLATNFVITIGSTNTTLACAGTAPQTPNPGGVLPGVAGTGICLGGGTSGADYALVAFYGNPDNTASSSVQVTSQNAIALATANVAPAFDVVSSGAAALTRTVSANPAQDAFETRLRHIARTQLTPRIPGLRAYLQQRRTLGPSLNAIPQGALQLNQIITLNANANDACSNAINVAARVAAISNTAYILSDTTNPAGGFTDAEYASFGATFDTLVSPIDLQNFGQPSDIDHNGKVVILFTKEVNKLTSRGAVGVVGGLFFERDLFPIQDNAQLGLQGCATSNVGEMFYLLVPDPNGVFSDKRSKDDVLNLTPGTLAHEYQHLINAARRLYVNDAFDFEEVWLNEGLSHIAEELLYYHVSGNAPRQNINTTTLRSGGQASVDAFNNYQGSNIGRFEEFLGKPSQTSVYGDNDELETRGATWDLLRYLADHRNASDAQTWQALVNAKVSGQQNLAGVFGADYLTQIRDWATSVFSDDIPGVTDARFLEQSWNMRDIFPNLVNGSGQRLGKYPLQVVPLADAAPANVSIVAGGEAYIRFSVPAGTSASIDWTSGGLPVSPLMQFTVVRTR